LASLVGLLALNAKKNRLIEQDICAKFKIWAGLPGNFDLDPAKFAARVIAK